MTKLFAEPEQIRPEPTGPVVAVGAGPMDGAVDLVAADGKRQRLADVPVENRPNRGAKLVEIDDVAEVCVI